MSILGDLPVGCYTSINTSVSTESLSVCGKLNEFAGAALQTVSITGYASEEPHKGCPASAGVSTTITRKYDCDSNTMIFLCDGHGSAYEMGNTNGLVSIGPPSITSIATSMTVLDSSSFCCGDVVLTSGYGLNYSGKPISLSIPDDENECIMVSEGKFYLQSFSLSMIPGQIPTASYTLIRQISRGEYTPG